MRRQRRAAIGRNKLELPATVPPMRVLWPYAISIVVYHLLALLACIPWLFSWTGVVLALCGLYFFGTLGINLCYHRLLTHQALPAQNGWSILSPCSGSVAYKTPPPAGWPFIACTTSIRTSSLTRTAPW